MIVGELREVCSRLVDRDGRGGRRVFSQRRRRSQDSSAANCEDERGGRGREMVEIVYFYVSYYYSYFFVFPASMGNEMKEGASRNTGSI